MVKILITGCAKSGTTLLLRLFNYFEKTYAITDEVTIDDFCKLKKKQVGKYDFVVAKRGINTIFSSSQLNKKEIDRQLKLITKHKLIIIHIERDKQSVLNSFIKDWGINNPYEWNIPHEQKRKHSNYIKTEINFNELLKSPNSVQDKLIEIFNFTKNNDFSNYPKGLIVDNKKLPKNYKYRKLDINKCVELT